ncbi:hypothetical protein HQ529_06185 [Candidatus Woesearchaeota archaeon]|nr:hypothetical protein [Candidatus Woesearchaeota archaeon]
MAFRQLQDLVFNYTKEFKPQYWPSLDISARLEQEMGELSKVLNIKYGQKREKPDEEVNTIEEEMADVLFTLCCLADSHELSIDLFINELMNKEYRTKGYEDYGDDETLKSIRDQIYKLKNPEYENLNQLEILAKLNKNSGDLAGVIFDRRVSMQNGDDDYFKPLGNAIANIVITMFYLAGMENINLEKSFVDKIDYYKQRGDPDTYRK